jgi:hypothetical protein
MSYKNPSTAIACYVRHATLLLIVILFIFVDKAQLAFKF